MKGADPKQGGRSAHPQTDNRRRTGIKRDSGFLLARLRAGGLDQDEREANRQGEEMNGFRIRSLTNGFTADLSRISTNAHRFGFRCFIDRGEFRFSGSRFGNGLDDDRVMSRGRMGGEIVSEKIDRSDERCSDERTIKFVFHVVPFKSGRMKRKDMRGML